MEPEYSLHTYIHKKAQKSRTCIRREVRGPICLYLESIQASNLLFRTGRNIGRFCSSHHLRVIQLGFSCFDIHEKFNHLLHSRSVATRALSAGLNELTRICIGCYFILEAMYEFFKA